MKRKIVLILKNEYIYSIITRFITFLIGMLQSVLIARYLGAELKGTNAYISSITSIGSIIITFGIHQAYPYYRKKFGKEAIYQDYISLISLIFSVYFIIATVIYILTPLSLEVKISCLIIPMLGFSNILAYVTLIETPNLRNSLWTLISIIEIFYLIFLLIFIERSFLSAVSILIFADLLKCIVYMYVLRVKIHISIRLLGLWIKLFKFGFFPMIALLMTTLNYKIDVLMLRQYDYITDSMIGVYSLGISLADKIVLIPDTLTGILVSKLAKGANESEVAKASRMGFCASILLCCLLLLFGRKLIDWLYGSEYRNAYSIICITAIGVLAVGFFKIIAQYNIVKNRQILNVFMLSIAIIVDVVLNLLFIPQWGIQGAALATTIGNIVCGIVFIIYFCFNANIRIFKMIFLQKSDIKWFFSLLRSKKETSL